MTLSAFGHEVLSVALSILTRHKGNVYMQQSLPGSQKLENNVSNILGLMKSESVLLYHLWRGQLRFKYNCKLQTTANRTAIDDTLN